MAGDLFEAARNTRGTVLVADDCKVNRLLVSRQLRALGYEVEAVANGVEAVYARLQRPYAAVVMDSQMPLLDGVTATREIRQIEEPGERVPIVALTATVTDDERERCFEAGMDAFLPKPINVAELGETLDRLVRQGE